MSRSETSKDLSVFDFGEKIPWEKRASFIRSQFPPVEKLDWLKAFRSDIGLWGRVFQDVLELDQATPGKPGPRPGLTYEQAAYRLRQLMGQDFSELPFTQAVTILSSGMSGRQLAAAAGLNRNVVQRLMSGQMEPDVYSMTAIARLFGKHPSYFMEYRAMYVAGAIQTLLMDYPETSVNAYQKIKKVAHAD